MNGSDTYLDVNNSHLRVTSGNVHASSFNLDQISIVTTSNTGSTINFLNDTKGFTSRSNIEVGTANLFVDTTTSNIGIGTNAPAYTLDVHGSANVGALTVTSLSGVTVAPSGTLATPRAIGGVNFDGSADITPTTFAGATFSGNVAMTGTGALTLPTGSTAQQPSTLATGMLRYNTETEFMEVYKGSVWEPITSPPTITSISPTATIITGTEDVRTAAYQTEILHPTPTAGDEFGKDVSLSKDGIYLLVGAAYDDTGGTDVGSAQVYIRSGTSWAWQAELLHPSPATNDYFGRAVSISGDGLYAVVGVYTDDTGGSDSGSAQVFVRNSDPGVTPQWTWQAELVHPSPVTNDYFGYSVSISADGTYVIVGAYLDDPAAGGTNHGSAQVFIRSETSWAWQDELLMPGGVNSDHFGISVELSGDGLYAIVGAFEDDNAGGADAGSAHVFTRVGTVWVHQAELLMPSGAVYDYFGYSVAISTDGTYALVGAYLDDTGAADAGSVQVFTRVGTVWVHQAELVHPTPTASDYFGESVAISGDGLYALAGVRQDDTGGTNAGSVQAFKRTGTSWTHHAEFLDPDPGDAGSGTDNRLGMSVAISSDGIYFAAGSTYDYVGGGATGVATGSVHVAYNAITTAAELDTKTQVFTATGTGITNGSTIELVGADGTNYDVVDTTAPNAAGTQITFKLGDLTSATAQVANRPYRVKVNSTSGLSAITATGIGFRGIWTSPAAGASLSFLTTASESKTLAGTDAAGGTNKTFAVAPGSVSTLVSLGLSLNASTGVLSGTIAGVNLAGTNVTFRVIDTPSGLFEERTFSIVGVAPLYAFTSHTFTPCGVSAILSQVQFGPTFAQMKTAYNSTVWYNTPAWFNEVSGKQGFQLWTVPKTGTYRITVNGAQGGRTAGNGSWANTPGLGATIRGDFYLSNGTKLVIIVGQPGEYPVTTQKNNTGAGGGGATWVLKENFTTSNNDVYMVAGGGGGASSPSYNRGTGYNGNGASQGVLGPGGAGGTSSNYNFGGAGGWTTNGTGVQFGYSPHNGAMGGVAQDLNDYRSHGGFGGGGGNAWDSAAGGAGATGGRGGNSQDDPGLGGTSYIMPTGTSGVTVTNRTFSGNHNNYDGSVYIQAPGTF